MYKRPHSKDSEDLNPGIQLENSCLLHWWCLHQAVKQKNIHREAGACVHAEARVSGGLAQLLCVETANEQEPPLSLITRSLYQV